MQKKPYISMPVIRRLPRYYRFLRHLDKRGVTRISSKELSEKMGFTASQVRQDFNCFGGYGQQGYGYGVHQLCEEIGSILGVDRAHKCILIGAGNLGKAIATHISYNFAGFDLIGIFDNSEQVVGQQIADLRVLPAAGIRRFCSENAPLMAILCVPDSAVKSVVELLYDIGIKELLELQPLRHCPALSGHDRGKRASERQHDDAVLPRDRKRKKFLKVKK